MFEVARVLSCTSPGSSELGGLLAATFPRGPGLYLNLVSFALVLGVYFGWLACCRWVDEDARRVGLHAPAWNYLTVGGGVLGLVAFWIVPWYFFAFPLLLILAFGPLAHYVAVRDPLVPPSERVATRRRLQLLLRRHLRVPVPVAAAMDRPSLEFLPLPSERPESEAARLKAFRKHAESDTVEHLFQDALDRGSEEMVVEPWHYGTVVREKIDGVFHVTGQLERDQAEQVLEGLKLLAHLDVNERRKPQRGVIGLARRRQQRTCALECSGTLAGERCTLRIMDPQARPRKLGQLGMPEGVAEQWSRLLRLPRGLLLSCGPAESGRRVTGYASLLELARGGREVIAIDDDPRPAPAHLTVLRPGDKEMETQAEALRQALARRDPSHVLVVSLRDVETAEQVYQAVKDGNRLIIATVDAHDALAGLTQLVGLGITPARLARMFLGALGQRLVRVLCPECKVRYQPRPETLRKANLALGKATHFCRPPARQDEGCPHCHGLGYRGRTGAFELLATSDRIRELLKDEESLPAVRQEALKTGFVPLHDAILHLVQDGTTSVHEMIRVLRS